MLHATKKRRMIFSVFYSLALFLLPLDFTNKAKKKALFLFKEC